MSEPAADSPRTAEPRTGLFSSELCARVIAVTAIGRCRAGEPTASARPVLRGKSRGAPSIHSGGAPHMAAAFA
eukprot:6216272-Prymnesium_polylepis.4